jgi:hypothetical protein
MITQNDKDYFAYTGNDGAHRGWYYIFWNLVRVHMLLESVHALC